MIWETYYHKFGQNIEFFKNLCTNYMANSEAMTSSTRSFAYIYSYRLVKKCFVKICETSKCHNFLIFQPIFIRFTTVLFRKFYSFFWNYVKPVPEFPFKGIVTIVSNLKKKSSGAAWPFMSMYAISVFDKI